MKFSSKNQYYDDFEDGGSNDSSRVVIVEADLNVKRVGPPIKITEQPNRNV